MFNLYFAFLDYLVIYMRPDLVEYEYRLLYLCARA